jgi:hypothetical protein
MARQAQVEGALIGGATRIEESESDIEGRTPPNRRAGWFSLAISSLFSPSPAKFRHSGQYSLPGPCGRISPPLSLKFDVAHDVASTGTLGSFLSPAHVRDLL